MTLTLTDEIDVDIDDAAAYLVNGYNAMTVRYYDCGASSLPREVSSVAPEAYWLAVRHDLLDSGSVRGLRELRAAIRKVDPSGDDRHDAKHRKRVAGLSSLRLLDMLARHVARERTAG